MVMVMVRGFTIVRRPATHADHELPPGGLLLLLRRGVAASRQRIERAVVRVTVVVRVANGGRAQAHIFTAFQAAFLVFLL